MREVRHIDALNTVCCSNLGHHTIVKPVTSREVIGNGKAEKEAGARGTPPSCGILHLNMQMVQCLVQLIYINLKTPPRSLGGAVATLIAAVVYPVAVFIPYLAEHRMVQQEE